MRKVSKRERAYMRSAAYQDAKQAELQALVNRNLAAIDPDGAIRARIREEDTEREERHGRFSDEPTPHIPDYRP